MQSAAGLQPPDIQTIAVIALAALIGLAVAFWPFRAFLKGGGLSKGQRLTALIAVLAFSGLGVAAYAMVGRPGLPDAPYEERYQALEAIVKKDPMGASPDALLEVLAERARRNPTDPRPHRFTGDVLLALGEPDRAIQSYQRAMRLTPTDPETMLAIAQTLSARPQGPPPMVVAGLYAQALRYLPADDPRRPQIEAALKEVAARMPAAPEQ
jgi:cytochrome c-type biogenesis protein CcmH/NrfG